MTLLDMAPELVWIGIGFLIGAIAMWLLNTKDKTKLADLITQLAVSEERLKQFQQLNADYKALQQRYLDAKNIHVELETRMNEQVKNAEEKLTLLKESEARRQGFR